jgi:adenylate cyclase
MQHMPRQFTIQAAKKAIELDGADANAHVALGKLYRLGQNYDAAVAEYRIALGLNSSLADAHYYLAGVLVHTGKAQEGIHHLEAAIRLSPNDDLIGPFYSRLAEAYFSLGDYEKAAELAQTSLGMRGTQWGAYAKLTSALAHLGRVEGAKKAMKALSDILEEATISYVRENFSPHTPNFMGRFLDGLRKAGLPETLPEKSEPLPLTDKPSIAVLPFQNMSGDPEQEYFADGMAEDIITALSRIRQFTVMARNSTFTYKGQAVDVQAVSKDLGVRYVLEGSVRKAGNKVRVSAQLIEGSTGNHLWAENYDRELEDIFAVQDEITQTVVGAIAPEITDAEIENARRKPPNDLDAWDCYLRGMWYFYSRKSGDFNRAQELFYKAVELDPSLAAAYAGAAMVHYFQNSAIGDSDAENHLEDGFAMATRAVELDDDDAAARVALGCLHLGRGEPEAARLQLEKAVDLNPSDGYAIRWLATAYSWFGEPEAAIPLLERSLSVSPRDPLVGPTMVRMAECYLFLEDFENALTWARRALREPTTRSLGHLAFVSVLAHLGRKEECESALAEMVRLYPDLTCTNAKQQAPPLAHMPENHVSILIDGLRKAGLPE